MSDEATEAKQQVNMEVDQAGDPESTKDAKNRDDEAEDTKNTAEASAETEAADQPANKESNEPKIDQKESDTKDGSKTELEEPAASETKSVSEEAKPEVGNDSVAPEETKDAVGNSETKDETMDISETPETKAEQKDLDMKDSEMKDSEMKDSEMKDSEMKDSDMKDSKVPEQTSTIEEKQPEDEPAKVVQAESEQKDDEAKTDAKCQDSVEVSKVSDAETSEDNVKSDDSTKEQKSPIPDTQDSAEVQETSEAVDTSVVKSENAKEEEISVKKDNEDSTDVKVESLEIKTSVLKTEPKLKEYLPAKVVLENIDDKKMQSLLQENSGKASQVSFATQIMDKDLSALDEELDDLKIKKSNNYEYLNGNNIKKKVEKRNKGTMKKPHMVNKGITCRVQPSHKGTQTDAPRLPTLVPIPVPIFMPAPMQMYQRPYPVPVPIPLPIPVPIFIPTTRNTSRGIKKFIKKMKAKLPDNVFEAQILEMAKGASGEKDSLDSDDSEWEDYEEDEEGSSGPPLGPPKPVVPTEDIENVIKAGNIVPKPLPQVTPDACPSPGPFAYRGGMHNQRPPTPKGIGGFKRRLSEEENSWQYKRMAPQRNRGNRGGGRRQTRPIVNVETNPALAALSLPPKERPDVKHHLKFTYGVNAWRHWVVGKNAELEKARAQGKYMKPFETDILKLRADELNYTLCMFVKEVRKPNGDVYASDSILYLTLGIQEYLFENGRIDNIFTDMYYEPFTSGLHEVIKNFKLPINELGYFVTRIEEEHLWESKQLGAHSPQVLLNTLIYFNAKYFMMKTLEDHSKLSFTHIMKHWKKGGTATPATKHPPVQGEKRTTLLRYYPPAHLKPTRHDDRKCFEQQELPDNPLRCPVKLYEFYLSHCPEGAKNKTDLFYLQPERSCVPDSPVWYSGQALNPFQLEKMLARILMVREVQEHMLADASAIHHA